MRVCSQPRCPHLQPCPVHKRRYLKHHNDRANERYSNPAHRRFRREVLRRAGNRCQWMENGARCTQTERLQAHHTVRLEMESNYDPDQGVALCPKHHALAEKKLKARVG